MKVIKLIFISLTLFVGTLSCDSLTVKEVVKLTSKNNVYLSFFGDGNPVALNYDRIFGVKERLFHTFKAGISYRPNIGGSYAYTNNFVQTPPDESGPIVTNHFTFNYGKNYTFFEIGMGTSIYLLEDNSGFVAYPILGLRRQSSNGSFRIFTHPFTLINDNVDWICPVGISFGICF